MEEFKSEMNAIETIIIVFVIIIIVLTVLSEPKISFQFGKAMVKSGVKTINLVFQWIGKISTKQIGEMNATNKTF
jgi:hypothetical protein